jgi:hypothetical protein
VSAAAVAAVTHCGGPKYSSRMSSSATQKAPPSTLAPPSTMASAGSWVLRRVLTIALIAALALMYAHYKGIRFSIGGFEVTSGRDFRGAAGRQGL